VKSNLRLPRATVLADGSYISVVYPSEKDRRHAANGVRVRVVEYRLEGVADAEPLYRLVTTILDEAQAPAADLAALYHERWEIEGALAELKTHLRGAQVVLREPRPRTWCARSSGDCCSRTSPCAGSCTRRRCGPTRTRIGCRSCMPCAWCGASCRWTRLFSPRYRMARHEGVLDEILKERVASSRGRQVPRGVKRKMSGYPLRPRTLQPKTSIDFIAAIRIAK